METGTRTLALAGRTLTYHVSHADAPGTPVVFLHPWFGCPQFWSSTISALPDRPCLAVDFYSLATGTRISDAGPCDLADAVVHMLDAEGLGRVDLVGNSVGGIVSQIIASTVPDRVRRLVLVGTGANTTGALPAFAAAVDRWTEGARSGRGPSRSAIEDTVGMLFTARPDPKTWTTFVDAVANTDPGYMAAVLTAARGLDLVPQLPNITAPTLIVRGTEDCARTAEHAATMAAGISNSRSVEMPGAGHSPMVDHPVEFTQLIRDHLDDAHVDSGSPTEAVV